jgi:ankyrin repeat protein
MKTLKTHLLKVTVMAILLVALFSMKSCNGKQMASAEEVKSTAESESQVEPPETDIFTAALFGDLKTIQKHIKAGTDLDQKDGYGSTALIIAATFGKTDVAEALIEGGADLNITNKEGGTALHSAAFLCRTEIVRILLDKGIDKKIKNNYGSTARESVMAPFEVVKPIYDQFSKDLGPLGLKLNYDHLEETRPVIADMLQ